MQKAQAEVDEVLKKSRLPSVEDIASFPYVTALFKEVLRLTPPAPLRERVSHAEGIMAHADILMQHSRTKP